MLNFKNEIKLAFSENKLAIILSIVILIISLFLGYYLKSYLYDVLNPVLEDFTWQVQSGNIELSFKSIFSNNIRIVFLMFFSGILFCFSALILAFNGFFVGYVVASTNDFFTSLLLIIPHGIFELPSCILACASGFVLFNFVFRFIKTFLNQNNISLLHKIYNAYVINFDKLKQAIILLIIASILMVIAGFIEVYLSIPLANFLTSI